MDNIRASLQRKYYKQEQSVGSFIRNDYELSTKNG